MSWSLLPSEIIQDTLLHGGDFQSVIDVYGFDRPMHALMDCQEAIHPHLTMLVDIPACPLSGPQQHFLAQLNVIYRLGVSEPLTFPKLKRAYLRSAHNPQCSSHTTIFQCMKSAAKQNLGERLRVTGGIGRADYDFSIEDDLPTTVGNTLTDEWLRLTRALLMQVKDTPYLSSKLKFEGTGLTDMFLRLSIIASKREYMQLAHEMAALANYNTFYSIDLVNKANYWLFKAQSNILLRPYKVKTTREIRDVHWETLYSHTTSDTDKAKIWRSKYEFPVEDIVGLLKADAARLGFDYDITGAALARLGIRHGTNADISEAMSLLGVVSGDLQLLRHIYYPPGAYATIKAVKYGYYEMADTLRGRAFLGPLKLIQIWGKQRYLYRYFCNFTLKQIQLVHSSLNEKFKHAGALDMALIYGGCSRLFTEYTQGRRMPGYAILEYYGSDIRSLDITNTVLASYAQHGPQEIKWYTNKWLYANYEFLIHIWLEYGREKFEDALIYLRSNFNVQIYDLGFLEKVLALGATGLLTYLFGYILHGDTLTPHASLIVSNAKVLSELVNGVGVFVRSYPDVTDVLFKLLRLHGLY